MTNALSKKEYWETKFNIAPIDVQSSPYETYFKKYIPIGTIRSCVEVGAFPGSHLTYFAKIYNCVPTAIDYVKDADRLAEVFKHNGIKQFEILKTDFLTFQTKMQYDLVFSFGFVEHFKNYREVIKKQMGLVRPNGYLVISVPFLRYFQRWIRQQVYTKEHMDEILRIHNLEIMNLDELNKVIFSVPSFTKLFSGYTREMTIWFEETDTFVRKDRVSLLRICKKASKIAGKLGLSNKFLSPEIMVIARKEGETSNYRHSTGQNGR